jgi:hypothetical protein
VSLALGCGTLASSATGSSWLDGAFPLIVYGAFVVDLFSP